MDYVFQNAAGRSIGGWTVPQESAGYSVSLSSLHRETYYSGVHKAAHITLLYISVVANTSHAPQPGENVKIGSMQYYTPALLNVSSKHLKIKTSHVLWDVFCVLD